MNRKLLALPLLLITSFLVSNPCLGATGTVKWFNQEKGYGFIKHDWGGQDVLVRHKDVEEENLKAGDRVYFEIEKDPKTERQSAIKLKVK